LPRSPSNSPYKICSHGPKSRRPSVTADSHERQFWNDYQKAYEETIRHTATKDAPWYVVPADNKWFTRVVVAAAVIDALDSLKLDYPKVGKPQRAELAAAKKELLAEK